jgi:integrase
MTGLRVGEILGLTWEDINFAQATVSVRQTVWRGRIQTAKTLGSEDVLPLPTPLAAILEEQRKVWKANPYGLVFVGRVGKPLTAENIVRDHLGPLLVALKIPHGGFHAFRHAHSSLLISGGASVKVAQEQLRHADPRMTIGRYAHVIGDARRQAVERLAAELVDPNGLHESGNDTMIQ